MEFLTSKFDELENEIKEKDEFINSLQIEVSSVKAEVKIQEKRKWSGATLADSKADLGLLQHPRLSALWQ